MVLASRAAVGANAALRSRALIERSSPMVSGVGAVIALTMSPR